MCEFIFIRHGKTQGNLEHRYIGSTNQPLLETSRSELLKHCYPCADKLYISPMLRCQQTAHILYPNLIPTIVPDFRESDFGLFEGKNYHELKNCPEYQKWLDSNGRLPFPQGEDTDSFKLRCSNAFYQIAQEYIGQKCRIALVIHGGTIMAILEQYALQSTNFYDWQVENGNGYRAVLNSNYKLEDITKLW